MVIPPCSFCTNLAGWEFTCTTRYASARSSWNRSSDWNTPSVLVAEDRERVEDYIKLIHGRLKTRPNTQTHTHRKHTDQLNSSPLDVLLLLFFASASRGRPAAGRGLFDATVFWLVRHNRNRPLQIPFNSGNCCAPQSISAMRWGSIFATAETSPQSIRSAAPSSSNSLRRTVASTFAASSISALV